MTGFDLPQNFTPNLESLLGRVRPRVVPPQTSLSAAEPVTPATSASACLLAPTNVTTGKAAMTPADANFGWQYFMNHE